MTSADDRLPMLPWERLRDKLLTLEGKPVAAYQTLEGAYRFERFVLFVDTVVVEPPGAPSPIRVRVDQAEARFPPELWSSPVRRTALEDCLARRCAEVARRTTRARGGRGGIAVDAGGQAILPRSSCRITEDYVELRAEVVLPAEGRKAGAKAAQALLFDDLGQMVDGALLYGAYNPQHLARHTEVAEDALALRGALAERGLVAFIADGAVLPREGDADRPLLARLVPFHAPDELRVVLRAPHRGEISGMGIPRGVTVIIGGAFSGRSTLLRAIASAVYAHIPGDGREYCATVPDAVMIQADEGRRVEGVNLTPFISGLPTGEDPARFRGDHAPALVAQAASIKEALEAGTTLLLFDEDTSAPRLLTRDVLWRHLAPEAKDPVTPLADLVRPLYAEHGVSTIIAGGTGSSLPAVADTVIAMDGFHPVVVTTRAKQLASEWPGARAAEPRGFGGIHHRVPLGESLAFLRGRRHRPDAASPRTLHLAREVVDLRALAQLVDPGQVRAIGSALVYAVERGYLDGVRTLREILSLIEADLSSVGLDLLSPYEFPIGGLALFRRQELAAAWSRLRPLRVRS
ncbi:MAG: ABC-ATPase domain-containing protein [Armatimonadota bacterium]|nr:ABC-ATPase domain-containing protein [Armatimonadota bacterium]MDR7451881.1 ABC-ATPase domain-containing protein [Armatimonadota bacterium]MDR7467606.1 ABC-ATPase domain-containing protein [Armatimonadota bacterium]MDR7494433.1 ABC-ATPase domain-containing protein [Armatimonadota bacterium]MDR7500413.1 ABC-ATPase domain-containing protein [Armatimonadota bacterium]